MDIRIVDINSVKPYEKNPRKNDSAVDKVAASLKEFGFQQPIVVDKNGVLIVGHTRLKAAKKLGLKEVPVLYAEELTNEQVQAYRLADNKTSEFAEWDADLLAEELGELKEFDFDMEPFGFEEMKENVEVIEDDFDTEQALQDIVEPITQRGDIWQLGRHRLMCGDSTVVTDVDRLMDGEKADMVFTDPPYGVSATGGRSKTAEKIGMRKIENDELRGGSLTQFLSDFINALLIKKGASLYICYPWRTQLEFTQAIIDNGYNIKDCIIWDKKVFGLNGGKGYRPQYEMMYFLLQR